MRGDWFFLFGGWIALPHLRSSSYRGIPYAEPPVGYFRWRPPQDPAPWTDVRPCVEFGPVCPQPEAELLGHFVIGPGATMSGDCLYLNVFTGNPNSGAAELAESGRRPGDYLDVLADRYPDLIPRVADFRSRIDERVRAPASEDDMGLPF